MEGPHFTFVDPRNHNNSKKMVAQALRLVELFEAKGYGLDCVIISVRVGP